MATRVRSYSKINLGLAVGPLRPDGYHGLATVYQSLALHDVVTVSARPSETTQITLTANHPGVPRTETGDAEKNTAYRIVAGALERLGLAASVTIDIEKRLPVQGGMGAGSANAAAALIGLEKELGVALPEVERLELAGLVGSDVPLFLLGGTVLGAGRGEVVSELPDLAATACVVAIPEGGVSTKLAFAALDRRGVREQGLGIREDDSALTFAQGERRLEELSQALVTLFSGAEAGRTGISSRSGDLAENPLLALVRTGIENDFEEVVFSQHPLLRQIKRELLGSDSVTGTLYAAVSGSGSALFGLYADQTAALAAQHRVQQMGVRAILTETLPRTEYWAAMFAE